jgi:oxygen-independent coproporphyrinogen III oxidase
MSSVAETSLIDSRRAATDTTRHLYVHIPFCARICPYCAFYKDLIDRSQTDRFCEALVAELRRHAQDRHLLPSTIYFGGGTPTALTTAQLDFVLNGFREALDLSQLVEWTMEANPGSISARKAALLKHRGVTRISLGVQSWDEQLLQLLGRDHSPTHVRETFRILREAAFANINVDLMFGLPGQTLDQWRNTLEKTIALNPDHISAYCLTYEEDTEFFLRHTQGELRSNNDADAEFFEMTMSILQEASYSHYEISNYARPGFESAHNRAYWNGEDYLGIGPSAFSTLGGERLQNVCDYRAYADRVLTGATPIASREALTSEMKRAERIALSLRTHEGIPVDLVQDRQSQVEEFVALGLLQRRHGNFSLTTKGKSLADSVAEAFI